MYSNMDKRLYSIFSKFPFCVFLFNYKMLPSLARRSTYNYNLCNLHQSSLWRREKNNQISVNFDMDSRKENGTLNILLKRKVSIENKFFLLHLRLLLYELIFYTISFSKLLLVFYESINILSEKFIGLSLIALII